MSEAHASSSSQSPTRKRARTNNDGGDLGGWERHSELYMSDGSVVLLAENTLFRVYSGLLSKHSDVFSGMASLSEHQPSDAETYDGCPLVRLMDDAVDVACFLETTMGISRFNTNQPTPFRVAAAVLRLATKYMVPQPRQQAIEHFARIIPNSIDEMGQKESYGQVFGTDIPHSFELVKLFQECQVIRFLPWAFYAACKEGFPNLVNGAVHDEKVIQLSREDNRVALLGWKWLRDETLKIRRTTVMSHAPQCACNGDLRMTWLDAVFYSVTSNTLEQWAFFKMLASRGTPLPEPQPNQTLQHINPCQACVTFWLETERGRRDQVWNKLPFVFEMHSWEEVQQE